jgi:hypothetical protein
MTPDVYAWLREEMEKLHGKLDNVQETQGEIRTTQAEQAKDIQHHIRRTDALERRVEQVAEEIKPVEDHVAMVRGVGKFLGIVATVVGIAGGIYALLGN